MTVEIKHRKMEYDDIQQLVDLFRELNLEGAEVSFGEVEQREEIESWMKDLSVRLYVSESKGEILGVFRAKIGDPGREHSCFLTAAVNKKYRGYKIAQNLTHYGLDELKKEGIKVARAYVYSNNPSSVSTLLKCGFTFAGNVIMHHFDEKTGRYVDDLIFHKIL